MGVVIGLIVKLEQNYELQISSLKFVSYRHDFGTREVVKYWEFSKNANQLCCHLWTIPQHNTTHLSALHASTIQQESAANDHWNDS
jgi:hypothetical protein